MGEVDLRPLRLTIRSESPWRLAPGEHVQISSQSLSHVQDGIVKATAADKDALKHLEEDKDMNDDRRKQEAREREKEEDVAVEKGKQAQEKDGEDDATLEVEPKKSGAPSAGFRLEVACARGEGTTMLAVGDSVRVCPRFDSWQGGIVVEVAVLPDELVCGSSAEPSKLDGEVIRDAHCNGERPTMEERDSVRDPRKCRDVHFSTTKKGKLVNVSDDCKTARPSKLQGGGTVAFHVQPVSGHRFSASVSFSAGGSNPFFGAMVPGYDCNGYLSRAGAWSLCGDGEISEDGEERRGRHADFRNKTVLMHLTWEAASSTLELSVTGHRFDVFRGLPVDVLPAITIWGNTATIESAVVDLALPPTKSWGGFSLGQMLWYTGAIETFESGDKLVYGSRGEVIGPATLESHVERGVKMRFSGTATMIDCYFHMLSSTEPPSVWGSFALGKMVWYIDAIQVWPDGIKLEYGAPGRIVGPSSEGVQVQLLESKECIDFGFSQLSTSDPKKSWGGFQLGQTVFFSGSSETFDGGDELVYACSGEVVGPATLEDFVNKGVKVQLVGNEGWIDCYFHTISDSKPPTVWGGFMLGQTVWHAGFAAASYGARGVVAGPAEEGHVAVLFEDADGAVTVLIDALSHCRPFPFSLRCAGRFRPQARA